MELTTSVLFGSWNHGQQIGVNHGSIHAEIHVPGKSAELKKRQPSFN